MPRRLNTRQRPITNTLLPTWLPVPATIMGR